VADEVTEVPIPNGSDAPSDAPPADDPAPWGYKADGTPYQRDPAIYAARSQRAGRKRSGSKSSGSKAKAKGPAYEDDVLGLIQLVAAPVFVLGTRNDVFLADAAAINQQAPEIARAVGDLAEKNERVARVLEKLAEVGPYGALLAAVAPLAFQVATNHGLLPPGVVGTVDPVSLAATIDPTVRERVAGDQADDQASQQTGNVGVNDVQPPPAYAY
jgi:hypothetical protein